MRPTPLTVSFQLLTPLVCGLQSYNKKMTWVTLWQTFFAIFLCVSVFPVAHSVSLLLEEDT